ncbi:MAG: hypothetical protein L0206_25395, partial [Actinobacteria bacterium]|nr:hypothetical protein [Actinomycetota bacterium]
GLTLPDGAVVRTGTSGSVRAGEDELGPNREARVREGRLVDEQPAATEPRPEPDTPPPVVRPGPPGQPDRPRDTPPSPTPARAEMTLDCRAAERGISCRWTPTDHPMFAAYTLVRDDGTGRRVVFRTTDRSQTFYADSQVARGTLDTYAIEARDAQGNILARAGPARAQSP